MVHAMKGSRYYVMLLFPLLIRHLQLALQNSFSNNVQPSTTPLYFNSFEKDVRTPITHEDPKYLHKFVNSSFPQKKTKHEIAKHQIDSFRQGTGIMLNIHVSKFLTINIGEQTIFFLFLKINSRSSFLVSSFFHDYDFR